MRGLVRGSAALDQPVKDYRDNNDTAADANQAGEQSGSSARYRAQEDQPKGAHPALVLSMNRTVEPPIRGPRGEEFGFTGKSLAPRYPL